MKVLMEKREEIGLVKRNILPASEKKNSPPLRVLNLIWHVYRAFSRLQYGTVNGTVTI